MKLGAHMPIAGGVWKALVHGRKLGCECVQLFLKNNVQWRAKPYPARTIERFARERASAGIPHVFAHASYLINLAGPDSSARTRSIAALVTELDLAAALELPFIVLHPGSHLGAGEAVGIRQIAAGLEEVFRLSPHKHVRVAIETTAGQGTSIGYQLEHLAAIFDAAAFSARLAVCLDTAHLFAAGYDIRTPAGWDRIIDQLDAMIGLDRVVAVHLNDSKAGLGSRIDRHEHIGKGAIGERAFEHIVNDPRFKDHPGCIETPKSEDLREDRRNLRVLRSLIRC
ncbi:MAG: deoxyribonuclease IV [Verrucomicrobiae bacterium]|nr:deoxyribonuclease IV [Verrucomicrobiae bacterium]